MSSHSGSPVKARAFEAARGHVEDTDFSVAVVPRSREVGQPFSSAALTTARALLHSLRLVGASRPAVVLCNGPGTCLPVAAAALLLRSALPGRPCALVYVESVARVRGLSLTGALLYHSRAADAFFVQWPGLAASCPRARCLGRLL